MILSAIGVAGALALAALLGVSDAPNATATLLAARAGSYPAMAAWSLAWHVAGGLLAGVRWRARSWGSSTSERRPPSRSWRQPALRPSASRGRPPAEDYRRARAWGSWEGSRVPGWPLAALGTSTGVGWRAYGPLACLES